MYSDHKDGYFWHFSTENLPEKMVWLLGELQRLYDGGFASGTDAYSQLGPFMAKMSQLNADISFCAGCMDVTFHNTHISMCLKVCGKVNV